MGVCVTVNPVKVAVKLYVPAFLPAASLNLTLFRLDISVPSSGQGAYPEPLSISHASFAVACSSGAPVPTIDVSVTLFKNALVIPI